MRMIQRSTRLLRRGVTATAAFGLSAVLTVTVAPARSDTVRSGTVRSGTASSARPCLDADGHDAGAVIRQGGECPYWGGPAVISATNPFPPEKPERVLIPQRPVVTAPPVCGPPYVDQDPRLGPVDLPATGYVGNLLYGYIRYGGLSPAQFLAQYWNSTSTPPGWNYPPDDGFAHDSSGNVLRFRVTLVAGQYIDRFGDELGRFLSPGGSLFSSRALPPDSLNTRTDDPAHLCNYHLYQVLAAFDVDGGPAAPAFAQPGGGLQYVLNIAYLSGAQRPLIPWLVANGYLRRVY